ncbi:MAG: FCD domain-containing protein [Actinomycetota bacterium]|nr:FCD domain-containing protein [Actinomycetota bacterium]
MIARGDFAVGDRLPPDREIAANAGVSRPTAREALLALELIGAVEVRHGDGAYVRGPQARVGGPDGSPLDAPPRELIETRRTLEPSVAAVAARRIGPTTLAALSRNVDEAADLVDDAQELPRFIALGLRFHADLAPGCGNGLLADIVVQLVDVEMHPLWALVNQQAMSSAEARRGQVADHRAILTALASGDPARAEAAMRSHLSALDAAIFVHTPEAVSTPLGELIEDRPEGVPQP